MHLYSQRVIMKNESISSPKLLLNFYNTPIKMEIKVKLHKKKSEKLLTNKVKTNVKLFSLASGG